VSEENQVVAEQPIEAVEQVDYKALYEKTKADLDTVAAKKDELYKETKAAKAAREQALVDARRIEEEKAMKDGEWEKVIQSTKKEAEELKKQLQDIKHANRREKLHIAALKVSQSLADGDNADLLSDFVLRNLDKMADETGSLSDDVLEAVKKEFSSNNKYKSLLRGSKASGGDAQGNTNTKAEPSIKEMKYDDFSKMDASKQMEFSKLVAIGKARLS